MWIYIPLLSKLSVKQKSMWRRWRSFFLILAMVWMTAAMSGA